ncbi:DUF169 domain-containing protein [Limisalsivibrio acetivorans]|uniref:DUF169 domain-containing protein n=1 Tax=Limisalsivibrio acetivorans TaxID=1304888 RepID=UPI0003B4FD65|nr:DUF169 domain-containing protein [Limisalsivibrio acetivorans]
MKSILAEKLHLKYQPAAVIFTDEKPEDAQEFKPGKWGCNMGLMNNVIKKGKTAVFGRETFGCIGGQGGLCLGDSYDTFPGGFGYFLSYGRGEGYPEGERYQKDPESTERFRQALGIKDIDYKYVVYKPLSKTDESENVIAVVFYVNPDQLSACVVLANFRGTLDNVRMPFGAGCHSMTLAAYNESLKEEPKAIAGMTDITVRPMADPDMLMFTMPLKRFNIMEEDAPESFLELESWKKLIPRFE